MTYQPIRGPFASSQLALPLPAATAGTHALTTIVIGTRFFQPEQI